ncbi:hypothetical protein MMC06_002907 [Schaereria dolodes]|nr:hypothetical protein [Schaereria dolodes]
MYLQRALIVFSAALSFTSSAKADGLYSKGSSVLQVDGKSYDKLIAKSNLVSIVEFYAPWCGHCKNLKPAYEKAAKSLKDLAQVAAINCDDEINKPFCGTMGVQGFPTLKIVKPSKKPGKPIVEDYQGPRTAAGIVDAVKAAIPNSVKRISDKGLDAFLKDSNDTAKAVLFSDKGTTSALIKVLASEYANRINFAQIRDKDTTAISTFGISTFPTLLVLPGGSQSPVTYEGPLTKERMKLFLNQFAAAIPESAPKNKKQKPLKKDTAKESSDSSTFSAASASHASAEASSAAGTASTITLENVSNPTESPDPKATPEDAPAPALMPELAPPLTSLETEIQLVEHCQLSSSHTCILALLPPLPSTESVLPETATTALSSLAALVQKHKERGSKLFPFYSIPADNPGGSALQNTLELSSQGEMEIVAVNWRRGWWRRFSGNEYSERAVEDWIDGIRLGEGEKLRIPGWGTEEKVDEPVAEKAEEPAAEKIEEPVAESTEEPVAEKTEEPVVVDKAGEVAEDEKVGESVDETPTQPEEPEPEEEPKASEETIVHGEL